MSAALPHTNRILLLDLVRTVALIGMAVFHTVYDLQMFGYIYPETAFSGLWFYWARVVAGTFMFLSGMNMWLSHGAGFRPHAFLRHEAILIAAALLVTVGTYFGVGPEQFVRFGMLHSLALMGIVGLLFLRLPVAVTLAVAAVAFVAPHYLRAPVFDAPWLLWVGLRVTPHYAVDYVPMLPWAAPFLAGLAISKLADRAGIWPRLRGWNIPILHRLSWPGRHSLAVYLIHQPVIFGLIWAVSQ